LCASDAVEADYSAKAEAHWLEFLNDGQLLARRKATKKGFPVLIVHPAAIDGSRLRVDVTWHWVSRSKGNLALAISDWGEVFFRFDCEQGDSFLMK
jgi:redox-sensitive bicupin YhaK (pirin superfamily)